MHMHMQDVLDLYPDLNLDLDTAMGMHTYMPRANQMARGMCPRACMRTLAHAPTRLHVHAMRMRMQKHS